MLGAFYYGEYAQPLEPRKRRLMANGGGQRMTMGSLRI